MALQIRRGTELELSTFTPAEGELIFDKTNKKVYVGDGQTVGGIDVSIAGGIGGPLSSGINLNTYSITGVGDINITGSISVSGSIAGDFEGPLQGNVLGDLVGDVYGNLIGGSIIGSDSSVLVDSITNKITGDLTGSIVGINGGTVLDNTLQTPVFYGSVLGSIIGDINGSLYGNVVTPDSTILVNSDTGEITNGDIRLIGPGIFSVSNNIEIKNNLLINGVDDQSGKLIIRSEENLTSGSAEFETFLSTGGGGFISFGSSRGTNEQRVKLENGDYVYSLSFISLSSNTTSSVVANIASIVDGTTTDVLSPGSLDFSVSDTSGNLISVLDIKSNGLTRIKKGLSTNLGQNLGDTGAVDLTTVATFFTTAAAETATLAAGADGQIKTFAAEDVSSGNMVVTVTNAAWGGAGTMTFSSSGSGCTLQYVNSKWFCIGNNGVILS